ncbi:MAG: ArnT family glycosyltransferase [Planctomycetota bacterium]|jgi:hypothetical protein
MGKAGQHIFTNNRSEIVPGNRDVRTPWTVAIIISLVVMSMYLFMGTRSTSWDRDEPHYARVTVEMVESGNYLVPTFNGRPWLDKPVLPYWLTSLPIRMFGPTEFACRFFAAVGIALTCLLTFFIGQRLLGVKAGVWAIVILASTSMVLRVAGSARNQSEWCDRANTPGAQRLAMLPQHAFVPVGSKATKHVPREWQTGNIRATIQIKIHRKTVRGIRNDRFKNRALS